MCPAALAWAADGAPEAGEPAPDFALPALSERHVLSLSDLRGAVVYLEFWNSFCAPCRASFPKLDALRERLPREDFEVVAVNMDPFADDGRRFLAKTPVSFPVLSDASLAVGERFGVEALPTGFLIDRTGIVREVHQGAADMAELDRSVRTLVAADGAAAARAGLAPASPATSKGPF